MTDEMQALIDALNGEADPKDAVESSGLDAFGRETARFAARVLKAADADIIDQEVAQGIFWLAGLAYVYHADGDEDSANALYREAAIILAGAFAQPVPGVDPEADEA